MADQVFKGQAPGYGNSSSTWPDALLVGICALLLLIELFLPPLIGLANNGDFGKIIRRLSLDMDRSQNLQYFVSRYQRVPTIWNSHLPMSEVPLAKFALALARLSGHRDVFDIRYLAFLHCVLLLLALYGFLRLLRDQPLWFRFALGALPVWIFTDVMYAAYFNSFYADTMTLLSMLLMVVLASHIISFQEAPLWMWIAFAAAALVFISSKSQHAVLAVFPAAFALVALARSTCCVAKVVGIGMSLVFLLAGAAELRATPEWYRSLTSFDVIFLNIPKSGMAPARELQELGLPSTDLQYMGANPFLQPATTLRSLHSRTREWLVLRLYLAHPRRTLNILALDLRASAPVMRTLPNYRREDRFPPRTQARHFCSWSDFRRSLYSLWPGHIVLWYGAVIVAAAWLTLRARTAFLRRAAAMCCGLALMGIAAFLVASLGDGQDTARHLFLFHAVTEVTICFAAAALLGWAPKVLKTRLAGDREHLCVSCRSETDGSFLTNEQQRPGILHSVAERHKLLIRRGSRCWIQG